MAAAEQKKSYQVVRQFRGVNTKADRTAINEDEFSWLENVMPIGAANLKITPNYLKLGSVGFTSTVINLFSVSLNLTDYLIAFEIDGSAEYMILASSANPPLPVNTIGTIAPAGTFSVYSLQTVATATTAYVSSVRLSPTLTVNILNVTAGVTGTFAVGQIITGAGIPTGITISSYGTGTGGIGTYYLNASAGTRGPIAVTGSVIVNGNSVQGKFNVSNWNNQYALILDPVNGYFTWDGTNLNNVGSVGGVGITNPGTGYTSPPTITISVPDQANGIQATALCSITNTAGQVTNILVNNPGSGYTSIPKVTISAPPAPGIRAVGAASISGNVGNLSVVSIGIINPGSGYTSAPSVTITGGGGAGANAIANVDTGSVNQIFLTNAGSGYTSPPTVTFSGGGGTNASAVTELLTFAQGTVAVQVTSGGNGYTNAANTVVNITGGGGINAAGTAIISGGEVVSVIMTNAGTGYTNAANITVTISGGGGSNAKANAVVNTNQNIGIDSFSGRVWIAQGRNVYYSAAGSISDFVSVSAGEVVISDSTLHGNITQLLSANNFLYVFGDDSINVFSDVQVTSTGTTVFTNTNISASIGSRKPYSIFPYFRTVLFMNDYGIYALVGSTTTKISDPLDGIFTNIDFTYPVYGGQVLLNNILCAVFNFRYTGGKGSSNVPRFIQAVFFDKKWFFTSTTTDMQFIASAPVGGKISMYGYDGSNVYQMYSDPTSNVSTYIQTALLPMGDPIRTKQALKFAVEATGLFYGYPLNVTVDSEYSSSPVYTLSDNPYYWQNDFGSNVSWINTYLNNVNWTGKVGLASGYYLYKSDAQQYGKYLGLTLTSTAPSYVVNTFEFEHELRVRF